MVIRRGYDFDVQQLAKDVKEKRTSENRSIRDLEAELDLSKSIISRIENAKMFPDLPTLGVICLWLGCNPAKYFILHNMDSNDPITTQLRAAQNMSAETAAAFMDLIRAAYTQILEEADEDEKA
jgi:transcriptional regulator with XRE-family HTH domain